MSVHVTQPQPCQCQSLALTAPSWARRLAGHLGGILVYGCRVGRETGLVMYPQLDKGCTSVARLLVLSTSNVRFGTHVCASHDESRHQIATYQQLSRSLLVGFTATWNCDTAVGHLQPKLLRCGLCCACLRLGGNFLWKKLRKKTPENLPLMAQARARVGNLTHKENICCSMTIAGGRHKHGLFWIHSKP
jgi:hypothetical protein